MATCLYNAQGDMKCLDDDEVHEDFFACHTCGGHAAQGAAVYAAQGFEHFSSQPRTSLQKQAADIAAVPLKAASQAWQALKRAFA